MICGFKMRNSLNNYFSLLILILKMFKNIKRIKEHSDFMRFFVSYSCHIGKKSVQQKLLISDVLSDTYLQQRNFTCIIEHVN